MAEHQSLATSSPGVATRPLPKVRRTKSQCRLQRPRLRSTRSTPMASPYYGNLTTSHLPATQRRHAQTLQRFRRGFISQSIPATTANRPHGKPPDIRQSHCIGTPRVLPGGVRRPPVFATTSTSPMMAVVPGISTLRLPRGKQRSTFLRAGNGAHSANFGLPPKMTQAKAHRATTVGAPHQAHQPLQQLQVLKPISPLPARIENGMNPTTNGFSSSNSAES